MAWLYTGGMKSSTVPVWTAMSLWYLKEARRYPFQGTSFLLYSKHIVISAVLDLNAFVKLNVDCPRGSYTCPI